MITTYYLIFSNSPSWFKRFLKPGYSHVSCVRKLDDEVGVEVNAGNHLIVDIFSMPTLKDWQENSFRKILEVEVVDDESPKLQWPFIFWRWGIFNCVSITKYMLGIKSWSITPHQLFRLLHQGKYAHKNKHIRDVGVM